MHIGYKQGVSVDPPPPPFDPYSRSRSNCPVNVYKPEKPQKYHVISMYTFDEMFKVVRSTLQMIIIHKINANFKSSSVPGRVHYV